MGAEHLEDFPHLRRTGEPVKRGLDGHGLAGIGAGEGCRAGEDAEPGQEIALLGKGGGGEAGGPDRAVESLLESVPKLCR